ncbi:MAG: hypothetical protein GF308_10315 [Candidatus Heimdallarchaeota archaeon]|nr:hypothetical protein [Candidatus Heimdallarchaeota archaeon]
MSDNSRVDVQFSLSVKTIGMFAVSAIIAVISGFLAHNNLDPAQSGLSRVSTSIVIGVIVLIIVFGALLGIDYYFGRKKNQ